jgi:hypothetical protein
MVAAPRIVDRNVKQFRDEATAVAAAGSIKQRSGGFGNPVASGQNSNLFEA